MSDRSSRLRFAGLASVAAVGHAVPLVVEVMTGLPPGSLGMAEKAAFAICQFSGTLLAGVLSNKATAEDVDRAQREDLLVGGDWLNLTALATAEVIRDHARQQTHYAKELRQLSDHFEREWPMLANSDEFANVIHQLDRRSCMKFFHEAAQHDPAQRRALDVETWREILREASSDAKLLLAQDDRSRNEDRLLRLATELHEKLPAAMYRLLKATGIGDKARAALMLTFLGETHGMVKLVFERLETKLDGFRTISSEELRKWGQRLEEEIAKLRPDTDTEFQARFNRLVVDLEDSIEASFEHNIALYQQITEFRANVGRQVAGIEQRIDGLRDEFTNPDCVASQLRRHIREKAEVEIRDATDAGRRWQEIDELRRRRDAALAQVDDVIRTILQGLSGSPDPIFAEAARILAAEGAEATIAYVSSRQAEILAKVESLTEREIHLRKEKQAALEPLLLQADLYETNMEWDKARDLFEVSVEKAPNWSKARRALGRLLTTVARYGEARPHLEVAWQSAADETEKADAAGDLGELYFRISRFNDAERLMRRALAIDEKSTHPAHRRVAQRMNNLAQVLKVTERLLPAELLMHRALALELQCLGHAATRVASELNNLAQLLTETTRFHSAEPLMRRALSINVQSFGSTNPNVATCLNNLAQLFYRTNRPAEAEPLYRKALQAFELSLGCMHPDTATCINNLGQLLKRTGRLAEAEPLMRRVLQTFKTIFGHNHPKTASPLCNLAGLLKDTNRPAEAEPLMRRVLEFDEQTLGTAHSDTAVDLNNLATVLKANGRGVEAEPICRRAVQLLISFGNTTGHAHPNLEVARRNYVTILEECGVDAGKIANRLREIEVVSGPFPSFLPEVERLLGPATPVENVLASLDEQYNAENRPPIYFLSLDEPISPHLDELLGPSILDIDLNESISQQLDKLLGPCPSVEDTLAELDRQYREQNKPPVWFLPLSEPISPHLDELLGPIDDGGTESR